ncbi:glycosyltransferase family 4 protein [Macrococcus lamae]|uniref:Glycosyltransferase WbuB n=1 Tax=Macrococcus lamae TaxID=198484 RepID=A0A4R6BS24_9STAP|nr:glycosyltransferase family 4 protein [Macrococcus lamae]TDM05194.1 glycosyltransferase WbuB [Macrococcus lamae]
MNILYLTLTDMSNMHEKSIYHDFVNELKLRGHDMTVVCPAEKRKGGNTERFISNSCTVLKVKIGDITKTSFVKKGINTLRVGSVLLKAINKMLPDKHFDLIIYLTPPITFNSLVTALKKKHRAKAYLLLKDIFPQNAVDLSLFRKYGPIYQLFRFQEKQLYRISDYIGGMSEENIQSIKRHNKIKAKTQIVRNAIFEQDYSKSRIHQRSLKAKLKLNPNKKLFIYGGNLGIPQGVEYIKGVMSRFHEIPDSQLLIAGNGTHFNDIKAYAATLNNDDIIVKDSLPRDEYDQLVAIADVGLIFLDHRFTIPNYPSRLASLLNARLPILAATDKNTDLKDELVAYECGFWNESTDVDAFITNAKRLIEEPIFSQYQKNAYRFFKEEFRIEDNIDRLLELVMDKGDV